MQSNEKLEISLFALKQYHFFLVESMLICRLLTQKKEHNLKNTPVLEENGPCIQGLDGYQDSGMVK